MFARSLIMSQKRDSVNIVNHLPEVHGVKTCVRFCGRPPEQIFPIISVSVFRLLFFYLCFSPLLSLLSKCWAPSQRLCSMKSTLSIMSSQTIACVHFLFNKYKDKLKHLLGTKQLLKAVRTKTKHKHCIYNIKESVGDKMFSTIARSTLLSNRPFALRGHVISFLWKWKLYEFSCEKPLVGHILNKIIVIWFFKPAPFS